MSGWSEHDVPDQSGRTVLVTGANSGLGLHTALGLARAGACVLLGCRDTARGAAALERVRSVAAGPAPALLQLDLADLGSVRRAAAQIRDRTGDGLDVLVNNAGVMATPYRRTVDGFELQMGTNHLGHAALTWLLAPALRPGARVVTVSSLAHRQGGLDLDDLAFERRRYNPITAYSAAKLANLLFALELDRRARAVDRDLVSVAAHPGLAATELPANTLRTRVPGPVAAAGARINALFAQSAAKGALPQLYAATAPGVQGGDYYGPAHLGETRGAPKPAVRSAAARDPELARRLWQRTAELTGVTPDPA